MGKEETGEDGGQSRLYMQLMGLQRGGHEGIKTTKVERKQKRPTDSRRVDAIASRDGHAGVSRHRSRRRLSSAGLGRSCAVGVGQHDRRPGWLRPGGAVCGIGALAGLLLIVSAENTEVCDGSLRSFCNRKTKLHFAVEESQTVHGLLCEQMDCKFVGCYANGELSSVANNLALNGE